MHMENVFDRGELWYSNSPCCRGEFNLWLQSTLHNFLFPIVPGVWWLRKVAMVPRPKLLLGIQTDVIDSCLSLSLHVVVWLFLSFSLRLSLPFVCFFPFLSLSSPLLMSLSLADVPRLPMATLCSPVTLYLSRPPINAPSVGQVPEWRTRPVFHLTVFS